MKKTFVALLLSVSGTGWLYLTTLDENPFSRSRIACFAGVLSVLLIGSWALLHRLQLKKSGNLHPYALLAVFLIAFPLSIVWPGNLAYLQVRTVVIECSQAETPVEIMGINTGNIDVPHNQIQREGQWNYSDRKFLCYPGSRLVWNGRFSNQPSITVMKGPSIGTITVKWGDYSEEISLDAPKKAQETFLFSLPIDPSIGWGYTIVVAVFLTLVGLLCSWYIQTLPFTIRNYPRWFWLWYALPILSIGLLMLLIYFPGIMSGDSLVQWMQAHDHHYKDQHPVFHTLLIWLITQIWDHPAAIVIVQVSSLAITAAWGIGNLVKRGLSPGAAWIVSGLFAASPVNWLYMISIWKDIFYAISLLLITLLTVEIYLTGGDWLKKPQNQLGVMICGLFVSLIRHNGYAVIMITLVLLGIGYKRYYRQWIIILAGILLLRWLITVPGYNLLKVEPLPPNLGYSTVLYHIGAHVTHGKPFIGTDRADIETLMPLQSWDYDPCSADPIIWSSHLNKQALELDPNRYIRIALRLLVQEPWIDVDAFLNIGRLVYAINPSCRTFIVPLYYNTGTARGASWIDFPVAGIPGEQPLLRFLVKPLTRILTSTFSFERQPLFYILFWRPVSYLLIVISTALGASLLHRDWKILYPGLPAVIQSIIILLVNVSQETRYQYGVHLIALYMIGLFIYFFIKRNPHLHP